MSAPSLLEIQAISYVPGNHLPDHGGALRAVDAVFSAGTFSLLRGTAESGARTLFQISGLLARPTGGEVLLSGLPTTSLSDEALAELRSRRFGFVFAAPFLLPSFSVIENVAMPLFKVSQVSSGEARQRTDTLLRFVELGGAAEARIADLPAAAQYRAALARSLVNAPDVLMVEALDGQLAGAALESFAALLRRVASEFKIAVIAHVTPDFVPLRDDRLLICTPAASGRHSHATGIALMNDSRTASAPSVPRRTKRPRHSHLLLPAMPQRSPARANQISLSPLSRFRVNAAQT